MMKQEREKSCEGERGAWRVHGWRGKENAGRGMQAAALVRLASIY
jgi:hypothetical protein